MRLRQQASIAATVVLALAAATPASAAPIEYIFSGTFDGSLDKVNYSGSSFTVTLVGDTANITTGGGEFFNTASSATFSVGATTGSLTGNYNNVALNPGFSSGTVVFGQSQPASPFFVAEGLSNSGLGSYDLSTAFALAAGTVSQTIGSTYFTDDGDLVFTNISALSFEADLLPTPLPASLPMFAAGLGLMAFYGWRKQQGGKA